MLLPLQKTATAEATTDSDEAVKAAIKGLTDKREIARATAKAPPMPEDRGEKIADAEAAVTRQDVAAA